MGLFSKSQIANINAIAQKSKSVQAPQQIKKVSSINDELNQTSKAVEEYFSDSPAILIETKQQLHDYITDAIEHEYVGIDTETTGLDRQNDYIVGASLYYPEGVECYIPLKHRIPIFEDPYKGQLSYEDVAEEFQRFVDSKVKLIFANANFDLYMIWKDLNVDLCPAFYYDVILAWRCLKEDELHNGLKELYNKYVLKGSGDPKRFSDFFSPSLFPYCKPEIAKLYAANDAKITYDLFRWQLPFTLKNSKQCQKNHLESIADLIWSVEFPLVSIIQEIERTGMYLDLEMAKVLQTKYHDIYDHEMKTLQYMVQEAIDNSHVASSKQPPFLSGKDFNPKSTLHVKYLLYTILDLPKPQGKESTGREVLSEINLPITSKIVEVRSLATNINTFVDKLPNSIGPDGKIHADFWQIGAATGRLSCISKGTLVSTPGGDKPIESLVSGEYVYCYDVNTNKLQLSTVEGVYFTGIRKCIKLKWRSKYNHNLTGELICTPDHFIRTTSGWVQAQDLKPDDSILYVHRRDDDNSTALYGNFGQGNEEEHRWVKSYLYPDLDSSEYQIHHIDRNRNNNDPRNLTCVSPKQHTALHLSEHDNNYCGSKNYTYSDVIKVCEEYHWELSKIPDYDYDCLIRNLQLHEINYIQKYTESYGERPWVKNPRGNYKKKHLPLTKRNCLYALNLSNGDTSVASSYFGISIEEFESSCEAHELLSNHSVYAIEYLDQDFEVYDITVKGYHNFIAGELCVHNSRNPNMMNIPSKLDDIRHMFRADPGYVMMSSDFSQQEPKLTAFVSQDPNMIKAFKEGKDIYATIASIAFNTSYENCLEFHPTSGEYQPDGKARRNEAKTIVLGICYGRSVPSIGEQLYNSRDDMTDEEKTKSAQKVYDSVMRAFPALERLMLQSQAFAHKHGYVETILGRRRHLPDMMLDEFEFKPLPGYVNPDIDPLDLSTLEVEAGIPNHKLHELQSEFSKFKYFGQIAKRTKQLYEEESIKVINNRPKINDAKRQCVNCVDIDTEILTLSGWKKYDQIKEGDEILSYSLEKNEIVKDTIKSIHLQESENNDIDVIHLSTSSFDAVCTNNHRWVMRNFDTNNVRFYETDHILKFHRPRYHILRISSNNINLSNEQSIMEAPESWVTRFLNQQVEVSELFALSYIESKSYYDYFKDNLAKQGCIEFADESLADKFQILCIMAGKVGNKRKEIKQYKKKEDKVSWKVSSPKKPLYQTARIDLMEKKEEKTNLIWCVTTEQGTWIARRNGKYYITGNSIIQGSAADFTKTALISVMNDPRWKAVGGQVLTVVHDEIVAQVPMEYWEEGARILKEDMENSGSFLPFPIKCDVTASYRWYGLEIPCKFSKPETLDLLSENDISWVQWHLVESGFELPIFKDEHGNKPIGDAAHGVSGQMSLEMKEAISQYCNRYRIQREEFLDDIESRVELGMN